MITSFNNADTLLLPLYKALQLGSVVGRHRRFAKKARQSRASNVVDTRVDNDQDSS